MIDNLCDCGTLDEALAVVEKEIKLLLKSKHCPIWILQIAAAWNCAAQSIIQTRIEDGKHELAGLEGLPEGIQRELIWQSVVSEMKDHWNASVEKDKANAAKAH